MVVLQLSRQVRDNGEEMNILRLEDLSVVWTAWISP